MTLPERQVSDLPLVDSVAASDIFPLSRAGGSKAGSALQIASYVVQLLTSGSPTALDTWLEIVDRLESQDDSLAALLASLAAKASLTGAETLTNKTLAGPIINGAPSGEFLRGHLSGLRVSNNAADPTNDIDIATGSAASVGATPVLMTLSSALTKRLDANWAPGSGNGMRYSGAAIANGFYYLFLASTAAGVTDVYADPSPDEAIALAHLQAETGGAGYVNIRRIWCIWRESGAIRPFFQDGDKCLYTSQVPAAYSNTNLPTTKTNVAPTGSPTGIRTTALINARGSRAGGALGISIWCPDLATPTTVVGSDDILNGANEINGVATNSTNSVGVGSSMQVLTDASGQIAMKCAAATTTVSVQYLGFIDTRGR